MKRPTDAPLGYNADGSARVRVDTLGDEAAEIAKIALGRRVAPGAKLIADVMADVSSSRITYQPASEITPSKPEWLWEGWLLRRALNLLAGRQGSGKTTFVAAVVGLLSHGGPLPGESERCEPIRIAILSLEEPADRVVARLHAAGCDLDKVIVLGDVEDLDDDGHTFRRRWTLPRDIAALGRVIVAETIALVIVDGLGYALAGDNHNYSVVGSALAALAGEAERTGAAILGITHPPKGSSDPVTAAIGSTAWTAIPRISMVLGDDPEDETKQRRVVRVAKSNYKMPSTGLAFTIAEDAELECGYIVAMVPSDIAAADITASAMTDADRTERAEAREFLRDYLAAGPASTEDVTRAAADAGISQRTLIRARKDLHVAAIRQQDPKTGRVKGFILALPGQNATVPTHSATPESWHTGHTGHTQGKQRVFSPESQRRESGTLDLDEELL